MEKKVIYLASGEKSFAHLLEYLLFSKGGYIIKTFSSNTELLKNVFKNPDIIILNHDFNNTLDTLKEIKKHRNNTPVIVLTHNYEKYSEELYYQWGVIKYIPKTGYFIDNLIETIEMAMDKQTVSV